MTTLNQNDLSVESLAQKSYLNFDQRQELERSIESTGEMLTAVRSGFVVGNVEAMEKQLAREREMLAAGSPPKLDTVSKNRLFTKVKELEAEFTHSLPTYEQMQVANPSHVDWHTAWERNHQRDVLAWKTGLMMLDPDNTEPNFRNIARLRGNNRPGQDPRKYWQGFEAMKMTAVEQHILDEMAEQLDDAAYMLFLQYKAAGWAKTSIMKKLEWSAELYEAANAKFQKSVAQMQDEPEVIEPDEVDEEVEVQEDPWPVPMIKAAGLSIAKFCQRNSINTVQFHKQKKTGKFTPNMKKAIDKGLKQLETKKSGVSEPTAFTGEPETTIDVEPTEE